MKTPSLSGLLCAVSSLLVLQPMAASADFPLRMQTDLGALDIQMLDSVAPLNVANFMNYVTDGDYDNSFVHRMLKVGGTVDAFSPFGKAAVVQGGGFVMTGAPDSFFSGGVVDVPTDPPVVNEFNLSNVRGTLAMAKVPQQFDMNGMPLPNTGPDSATSGWFFNVTDNAFDFDTQNGGFTVFGQVLGNGMNVIDDIGERSKCLDVAPPFVCASFPQNRYAQDAAIVSGIGANNTTLVNVYFGLDSENDGAIDRLEDAGPNAGDANNDTIQDSTQQHVASFPGEGGNYVILETSQATPFSSIAHMDGAFGLSKAERAGLLDLAYSNGMPVESTFVDFDLTGVGAGGSATVILTLPAGSTPDTFFQFGPTPGNSIPHWYEFNFDGTTGAQFAGNIVTLNLVDGLRGDADMDGSNGVIDFAPGGSGVLPIVQDMDIVDDAVEDGAPNGGDGNNDGTLDSQQSHVASFQDINADYVTVESVLPHTVHYATSLNGATLSFDPTLDGLNFEHGFFSVFIGNVQPGGTAQVKLTLSAGAAPESYYMFGPEPGNPVDHWYQFDFDGMTGAVIVGNEVTLHFVDGQRGDADLLANGIIMDPGGPAVSIPNTSGPSGGGCTLAGDGRGTQHAGHWLLLLVSMLILYGYNRIRKR